MPTKLIGQILGDENNLWYQKNYRKVVGIVVIVKSPLMVGCELANVGYAKIGGLP